MYETGARFDPDMIPHRGLPILPSVVSRPQMPTTEPSLRAAHHEASLLHRKVEGNGEYRRAGKGEEEGA